MKVWIKEREQFEATQWQRLGDHPAVLPPGLFEAGDPHVLIAGEKVPVHPGDWIVDASDGVLDVYSDAEFKEHFVEVGTSAPVSTGSGAADPFVVPAGWRIAFVQLEKV